MRISELVRDPRPLAAALLLFSGCTAATPAYPTGQNRVLRELIATPGLWADRFIAVEGKLLATEVGLRGQLLLRIRAEDPDGEEHELAVGTQVEPPEGWLEEGNRLRLGGYLTSLSEDEDGELAQRRGFLLLAVCVVNDSKDQALVLPEAVQTCQAWSGGAEPESRVPPR
jgi:hypothetical protein